MNEVYKANYDRYEENSNKELKGFCNYRDLQHINQMIEDVKKKKVFKILVNFKKSIDLYLYFFHFLV